MTAGDEEAEQRAAAALEALYRAEFARFVGLARWIVGDARLAEELVNDTFVRLLERPPTLIDPANLRVYVRTAILNRSRSRVRRLVLERRHARHAPPPVQPPETETVALVRAAIASLPRRQREVVVLRFHADLDVAAIAATLGIGVGSVKTHLHRALRSLAERIEATDPDRAVAALAGADPLGGST